MSGLFITMEGTDGAGKTTQIELLKNYLSSKCFDVVFVREPGGTNISEQIRDIILNTENSKMDKLTETLLYSAARSQLVNEVIVPELKKGSIVLCDRYIDSSVAYQGYGRKLDIELIEKINNIATGELIPDITIFLDLSPEEALRRKKSQKKLDRLEEEDNHFHNRVYCGYKELITFNKKRIKVVDASQDVNVIHNEIIKHIDNLFTKLK